MDQHLAYFTGWLQTRGASGGMVDRYADQWRRLSARSWICPACFAALSTKKGSRLAALAVDLHSGVAVCTKCTTCFEFSAVGATRAQARSGAETAGHCLAPAAGQPGYGYELRRSAATRHPERSFNSESMSAPTESA